MPRRRPRSVAGAAKAASFLHVAARLPVAAVNVEDAGLADVEDAGLAAVQDKGLQESGLVRRLKLLPPPTAHVQETREAHCLVTHAHLQALLETGSTCDACGGAYSVSIDTVCMEPRIAVTCGVCETTAYESAPSSVPSYDGLTTKHNASFVAAVYDSLTNGLGSTGLCRTMDNLCVTLRISFREYYNCAEYLYAAMKKFYSELQPGVLSAVAKCYDEADGLLDIDVSYDGTWMTRGHRSHIEVSFVIECNTGFIVDFEVISNYCEVCTKKKNSVSSAEFELWYATHTDCKKNFDGKAGPMESEGAVRMWSRSEALGYRYITFVSDGDSSAFKAVRALNDGRGPYTVPVVKEECVNHVSKRLGTRLCKLKDSLKVPTTTKKGKIVQRSRLGGHHGLTEESIVKLTGYYGANVRAIPEGGTAADLRNLILTSYYHGTSTDAEPRHEHCPPGPGSWCFVKKAEAAGVAPDLHSTKNLHLVHLSKELRRHVFQVYLDLTVPTLLERCLKKRTQNANESLHSKLWMRCLKVKDAKLSRVWFNACDTVLIHNCGRGRGSFILKLGLSTERIHGRKEKRDSSTPVRKAAKRRKTGDVPGKSYAPGGY